MSEWVDIPLAMQVGEKNLGSASPSYVSDASLVNLEVLENPPGTRAPFHIAGVPGWQELANQPGGTGDFRGMCIRSDGMVFVVRGTAVYYADVMGETWTQVPVGTMPGTATCRMVDAGTHVVMVDGTNAAAATTAQVFACSRGNFNGVAYQDGYTIYTEGGSDSVYVSAVDDPTTIGALDFTTADALPGDCVGVISDHRELYVFKQASIEHYYNAGGSGFPFVRGSPGLIEKGAWAGGDTYPATYGSRTIVHYERALFWLGNDRRVYKMEAYRASPISTPWVDTIIAAALTDTSDIEVYGSAYSHNGQPYYVLASPHFSGGNTLIYNIKTGLWHQRSSTGLTAIQFVENPFATSFTPSGQAYAAVNKVAADGKIRRLRNDVSDVDSSGTGTALSRVMTCPQISFGGRRAVMHEIRLDAGSMTLDSDGITLQWSDDGGATYNTGRVGGTSAPGLRWLRLGSFKQRILRLTIADEVAVQIMGLRALVDVGAA